MPIGNFGIRLDDVLILISVPLFIINLGFLKLDKYTFSIVLFLVSVLFSIVYGYSFRSVEFSVGDFNEYIRYCKILFFAILLGYLPLNKLIEIIFNIFYWGSYFLIIVGYLQYFDPFGMGKILSIIYTSESQLSTAIEHDVRRIAITGGGPNDGAIIVSYFILFNFFSYLFTNSVKRLLIFFLLFSVLFFTQSRTVILGTVMSLLFIFFTLKGYWKKKLFLFFIMFVAIYFLSPLFVYVFTGFEAFIEGEDTSTLVRYSNAENASVLINKSPFWGYGIAKTLLTDRMDSEYLSILIKFGFIGLFFCLNLVVYPFFIKRKVKYNLNNNILYFTLLGSSIIGLFVMVTNTFITGYQSFLPFILLMVAVLNSNKNKLTY